MRRPNILLLFGTVLLLTLFLSVPVLSDHTWGGEQGLVDTTTALTDHSWGGEQGTPAFDDGGWDDPAIPEDVDDTGWADIESYFQYLVNLIVE